MINKGHYSELMQTPCLCYSPVICCRVTCVYSAEVIVQPNLNMLLYVALTHVTTSS